MKEAQQQCSSLLPALLCSIGHCLALCNTLQYSAPCSLQYSAASGGSWSGRQVRQEDCQQAQQIGHHLTQAGLADGAPTFATMQSSEPQMLPPKLTWGKSFLVKVVQHKEGNFIGKGSGKAGHAPLYLWCPLSCAG